MGVGVQASCWNSVKEGGICIKLDLNGIPIKEPQYNHFYTIAKPFHPVRAQCITPDVLAFAECSNGAHTAFGKDIKSHSKTSSSIEIIPFHDIPQVADGLCRQ